jgi:hypothetical protein
MDVRTLVSGGHNLWSYKYKSDISLCEGTIELEYGWQLVAIPVMFGYWDSISHKHIHNSNIRSRFKNYVLDQITDLYGQDIIGVANTYTGDSQAFYSFIPGVTPESSPHNFNLIYSDGDHYEVSGFWINIIGVNGPYVISWGE